VAELRGEVALLLREGEERIREEVREELEGRLEERQAVLRAEVAATREQLEEELANEMEHREAQEQEWIQRLDAARGGKEGMAKQSAVKAVAASIPLEVAKVVRDRPHLVLCAFKDKWDTPSATITYDSFLANHNNTDCSCCGSGGLDLATGIFTCTAPGHYTVTFSCCAKLEAGQGVWLSLHLNGEEVAESKWRHKVAGEKKAKELAEHTLQNGDCRISRAEKDLKKGASRTLHSSNCRICQKERELLDQKVQNIWLGDWVYTQGARTVVSPSGDAEHCLTPAAGVGAGAGGHAGAAAGAGAGAGWLCVAVGALRGAAPDRRGPLAGRPRRPGRLLAATHARLAGSITFLSRIKRIYRLSRSHVTFVRKIKVHYLIACL
jgi:hypothetical protein